MHSLDSLQINKRTLLHHFFRYLEATSTFQEISTSTKASKKASLINKDVLVKFGVDFSEFLRSNQSLAKFKTLNKPNFFNLDSEILPESAFQQPPANIENILKSFEAFLRSSAKTFDYSLSYKFLSIEVSSDQELFNDYMSEFFKILFGQFKLKRDNFKINEQIVLDVHARVVQANPSLRESFLGRRPLLDQMCLLTEFELYAECVHKYLPKVRQYNQYLLFHYVWTMQVQYLAPFFNYLSDLYSIYNWLVQEKILNITFS